MLFYKINSELRDQINKSKLKLGCIESCDKQLIALDEYELLLKGLNGQELNKIKSLKKDAIFLSTSNPHICKRDTNKEEDDDDKYLNKLLEDKIAEKPNKKINPFKVEIDYEEIQREKKEKELYATNTNSSNAIKPENENNLAFAYNMVGSFIFVALGSYYLGKYVLEWKDAHTYVLTLIISIVVILAESILLMMKLHRSNRDLYRGQGDKLKKTSFAYSFNKSYRDKFKEFNERQREKFGPDLKVDKNINGDGDKKENNTKTEDSNVNNKKIEMTSTSEKQKVD